MPGPFTQTSLGPERTGVVPSGQSNVWALADIGEATRVVTIVIAVRTMAIRFARLMLCTPPGMRNYWKSDYMTQPSDDAIDLLVEEYPLVPAPHTHLVIE